METCKHCEKEYDRSEVKRVLGKESAPYLQGYCSAPCYTKAIMNPEKYTFEPAGPIAGYGFIGTIKIKTGYEDSWCQVFPGSFYMGNKMLPVNKPLLEYIEKVRADAK